MVRVFLLSCLLLISGCAGNYQFGDFSQAYCTTANNEVRTYLKAKLTESGVKVGVDYCLMHGFAKAVL